MADELDSFVARLRSLGNFTEQVARDAAPAVELAMRENASKGLTPEGKEWVKTKTGGAPLQHAAEYISATAKGEVIELALEGYHVFHNFGTSGKGALPRRQIIPQPGDPIPKYISKAIEDTAQKIFARRVGTP